MSDNLPTLVVAVGGPLEKVIIDVVRYTDVKYPLDRSSQIALARIIEAQPELNTEVRVAYLVDAFSFHGVRHWIEFARIVEDHGIECACLVLDYLHEVGERSHGDDKPEHILTSTGIELVRCLAELVDQFKECGFDASGVASLDSLIQRLGGVDDALDADNDQIRVGLSEEIQNEN